MTDLQRALRTAAWKLTLARAATAACVVVAAAAGAWTVIVLVAGGRGAAFAAVAGFALAAITVGAWRSRSSALEAARRVEQVAGWQERLSTAVELDESRSDNAFRERLVAEARALLERHSPAALIPWDIQRPAVVAGVLVVVAGVVSAIFPSGLRLGGGGELTPERVRAAERIEDAIARIERAPAGFADLRARLAGVLNDVRANRPAEEVRRGIDRAVDELDRRALEQLRDAAMRAADELARSPNLRDLADAVRRLDASGVRAAGGKTASQLASMTDAQRQGASSSLASSAERSESPGMSAPMWEMKRAIDARDVEKFGRAVEILAAHVDWRGGDVDYRGGGVDSARQALVDARSALGGGEPTTPGRRTDFFVESKRTSDNATASSTGSGNLIVRGKPEDIKSVWEGTKAVDARVPQLPDVIQDARTTADSGALDPRVRDYVKRYFSFDNP